VQTRGLVNVSGILSISYTDASPTVPELLSKIWAAYEALAGPNGYGIARPEDYVVVMHPRRLAFLAAGSTQAAVTDLLPGSVVVSAALRANLGASTNEDEIFVIAKSMCFIAADPPRIEVHEEIGSATSTVRIAARQAMAAMFGLAPNSAARISGTGLTPPSL
jgi:hypothetical protein